MKPRNRGTFTETGNSEISNQTAEEDFHHLFDGKSPARKEAGKLA